MRGRGLLIAFIVSLAVNLFLLSAAASIYLLGKPAAQVGNQAMGMKRAVAALPPSDRKPFVAMLRANGDKVRGENHRARALREQAWSALATGSETPEAIKQQLAEARAINQASRTVVENAVVDYGMTLDPAGRQAVGQALRPSNYLKKSR